jgi:hypothetical protein
MAHRTTPLQPAVAAPTPVLTTRDPIAQGVSPPAGLTPSTLTALQGVLSARDWVAEWIIDPAGDASIVVLAVDDDPLLPGFLLHSRNSIPHVATIANDVWQADQAFAAWPEAAAATVLMAQSARPPSDTATTRQKRDQQAA